MTDETQLVIITEDGVHRWNAWRAKNPEIVTNIAGAGLVNAFLGGANFEKTNLQDADLTSTDLSGANLCGANLTRVKLLGAIIQNADLTGADLTGADLTGANLLGTNLTGAVFADSILRKVNFTNADLRNANFRGAVLGAATFNQAKFNEDTLGLGGVGRTQRSLMQLIDVEPIAEDTSQNSDDQIANNLTVGYAKSIVGPAHWALQSLSIPNDLNEDHRDLFVELVDTVAELHQKLAATKEENRRIADETEDLRNSIDDALPLWKSAWETFVLKAAEGAGISAGKGVVFTAGFVAGMTYSAFTTVAPGISI